MTAQEALDKLDKTVLRDLEWKIALTEALEKQIPKKPIFWGYRYGGEAIGGRCPVCNRGANSKDYNYCHGCGQKLDWN